MKKFLVVTAVSTALGTLTYKVSTRKRGKANAKNLLSVA